MARYKRISKKLDIKGPDEFVSFWQHAYDFASVSGEKLLLPVIGVAVAAILGLGFYYYGQQKERTAQVQLYEALKDYPRAGVMSPDAAKKVIEGLADHGRKFPGANITRIGKLYRANALLQSNNPGEAAALYKEVAGDDLPGQLATLNIAVIQRQEGKFADANATLEKLRQSPFFAEEADFQTARNYELMGNAAKAREEYGRFLEKHSGSTYATEAKERKERLS